MSRLDLKEQSAPAVSLGLEKHFVSGQRNREGHTLRLAVTFFPLKGPSPAVRLNALQVPAAAPATRVKPAKTSDEDASLKRRLFPQAGRGASLGCGLRLPFALLSLCLSDVFIKQKLRAAQTDPAPLPRHPPPTALRPRAEDPGAAEPGGLHGWLVLGGGVGGCIFYILLGALVLQSCSLE